jgi:hypothetical protein
MIQSSILQRNESVATTNNINDDERTNNAGCTANSNNTDKNQQDQ